MNAGLLIIVEFTTFTTNVDIIQFHLLGVMKNLNAHIILI